MRPRIASSKTRSVWQRWLDQQILSEIEGGGLEHEPPALLAESLAALGGAVEDELNALDDKMRRENGELRRAAHRAVDLAREPSGEARIEQASAMRAEIARARNASRARAERARGPRQGGRLARSDGRERSSASTASRREALLSASIARRAGEGAAAHRCADRGSHERRRLRMPRDMQNGGDLPHRAARRAARGRGRRGRAGRRPEPSPSRARATASASFRKQQFDVLAAILAETQSLAERQSRDAMKALREENQRSRSASCARS